MKPFEVLTALITPFKENGQIDYEAFACLIEEQLVAGVDGFIVCGTTAETPCLKEVERFDILMFVLEQTKHCVPIWFGCGTNCTKETIRLVNRASYFDIDGVLLVTPYYNKPSQQGLYTHFKTIAEAVDVPIMLYQVPSRCGVKFEESTLQRLFQDCESIVGLKYASDDYDLIDRLHHQFPNKLFYSGEDRSFMNGMDKGLQGLVSVMSNAYLKDIKAFLHEPSEASIHFLEQASTLTFLECSPSAIKYILSKAGKCHNVLRLPLMPLSDDAMEIMDQFLDEEKNRQAL